MLSTYRVAPSVQRLTSDRKQLTQTKNWFVPKIKNKSSSQEYFLQKGNSRFEKLYKEESRRRIKQHQLQKESEVAGCTFQPKITEKGKASAAPAVKKRFDLLYESKRESLEQLEEKRIAHELSGCTFKVCNPPRFSHALA